ncbi:hypothetical protein [Ekhidna sp.]|uniref:hypothetical protein n=1 Tax=Ekhidna sp. TaxID=2608089 RepID=UPI003299208A
MKKIKFLILLLLCSCTSITEEIYLNNDGSGEYLVYTDVISSTRGMMMGMMSSIYPDASEDSLRQVIDAQIWADMPDEVDSLIDFSTRVPDSIKNDPDNQKYLERIEMFMRGSKEKGYLNSGMSYKFEAVNDLEDFLEFMNENQSATSGGMGMDLPNMQVKYSFDGKSFSRTTIIDKQIEMNDSTMMMLNTLLEGSKSRLIIHLPKNVKKASKDQLVEKQGKDVIYEFDLLKVLNGEQATDIKIDF